MSTLRRGSVAVPVALLIVALALPFLLNGYHVFIFSMAFAYVIAAVGFDMALGRAGLLAFTGSAFFGIGAFVAGRLATLGVPTELALLAAVLAGAVIGFLYGALTVRLQAYYFAITGIVVMLLLNFFYRNAEAITGGYSGFSIPAPSFLLAGGGTLRSATAMYFVGLSLAVPAFVVARLIGRSRIGRSWRVVREAPAVAEGLGINVWQARLLAVVLSSAYLALGGAWFGYLSLRFLPESFMFEQLLLLFLMLIIGGLRSVTGSAIGAVILIWFNQYLAEFVGVSDIIYGISLLACVLLFSRGIYGTLSNRFRGFRESLL
jgi:branched-chain amino acid transport system permease protein